MRKDTRSMLIMVTGTFIIGIGSELITPTSLILGSIIGLIGCMMFFIGAIPILKSTLKNIPKIILLTKEASKKIKNDKK